MDFHDEWLRRTPAELLVPEGEDVRTRFEAIAVEARRRAITTDDPMRFPTLDEVSALLDGLQPEGVEPERAYAYGVLAYFCFRAWSGADGPLLLCASLARALVVGDDPPLGAEPPTRAGYVQLPRQLFWMRPSEDAAAEPVDGVYWEVRAGELGSLIVYGIRDDRPGLGMVVVPPLPVEVFVSIGKDTEGPSAPDFRSTLPGGPEAGLLSLQSTGEVYLLLSRLFDCLSRTPEVLSEQTRPEASAVPLPSRLDYRRVCHPRTRVTDAP